MTDLAPMCRQCWHRHWYSDDCIDPPNPKPVKQEVNNQPDSVKPKVNAVKQESNKCQKCQDLQKEIARLKSKIERLDGKKPFDRKEYMREYMRSRRANTSSL